jgi:hypothetical protein
MVRGRDVLIFAISLLMSLLTSARKAAHCVRICWRMKSLASMSASVSADDIARHVGTFPGRRLHGNRDALSLATIWLGSTGRSPRTRIVKALLALVIPVSKMETGTMNFLMLPLHSYKTRKWQATSSWSNRRLLTEHDSKILRECGEQ